MRATVDLNFTIQSIKSLSFPLRLIPPILNMRIRNSRPSFPIPQVPQAVLRSNHLRSQFRHFDERFLVEEENRRIGWLYYPLRKHSSLDVQKVRPHDGLQSAIASEIKSSDFVEKKTGKENCMPAMQSHVSQKLEEPDKEGRTSNSSASSKRNVKGPRFSASVVLALPAPCTQPETQIREKSFGSYIVSRTELVESQSTSRGKKVYRTQKELPLKKRKKSRKLEIERTQAEREEATTVKPARTKEAFNKHDTSQITVALIVKAWRKAKQKEGKAKEGFSASVNGNFRHGSKLMQRSARPHMK
ncbi:hypothetical protein Peur_004302 [Populus x canadensis]